MVSDAWNLFFFLVNFIELLGHDKSLSSVYKFVEDRVVIML